MKKALFTLVAILLPLYINAQHIPTRSEVGPEVMPHEIAPITAPFEMAQMTRPTFPDREVTVKLKRKGMQTERIQKAIDRMAAEGGGTVHIPAGVWQTGRIELKSHVNLHLDEGAELHFSGRVEDYLPVVYTRDEGIDIYSLGAFIYANGADNIALTGRGKVVGPTTDCEIYRLNSERAGNIEKVVGELPLEQRIYDGKDTGPVFLPKTFAPINCTRVLIEGVTLEQGLYWNIVPQYCSQVIVRGVTVRSHGHGRTDGLDVDSSDDVLVEYCSFDCQDDCYTIKSGRGWDGLRVNRPTERVVIRHSLALRGAGGIVCGTETAGGIKNVYMHDCVFDGTDRGFRFKARRTRGGTISNIYVERVRARLNYDALYCDHLGSVKWMGELAARYPVPKVTRFTPSYHTISIHDVIIEQCRNMVVVEGMPESPLKHLFFGNATVKCQKLGYVRDASGFSLKDIRVESADSVLTIDNAPYSSFYGVNSVTYGKPITIRPVGKESRYLNVQEVPMTHYLFAYFTNDKTEGQQVCYAVSENGLDFTPLNDGNPVIAADTISRSGGVRDPHLLRAEDGRILMSLTDMDMSKGKWTCRGIVLMQSDDLVNWKHAAIDFPTRYAGEDAALANAVWAPQTIYDPEAEKYMVYFSLHSEKDGPYPRDAVFYAYANEAFTDLEGSPKRLFHFDGPTIDTDIVRDEADTYHVFFNTWGGGMTGRRKFTATSLTDSTTWALTEGVMKPEGVNMKSEGSSAYPLNDGSGWVLAYDCYADKVFHFCTTTDLTHFKLVRETKTEGNFTPRHGSILPITQKEYERLVEAW